MICKIYKSLRPHIKHFLLLIILFVISALCEVGYALCKGTIADSTLQSNVNELYRLLFFMTFLTVIQILMNMLAAQQSKRLQGHVFSTHNSRLINAILSAKYSRVSVGSILTTFTNDLSNSALFLTTEMLKIFSSSTVFFFVVAVMLYLRPGFTLLFFVFASGMIFLQARMSRPIAKHTACAMEALEKYNSQVLDYLQNPEMIIAYGLDEYVIGICEKSYSDYMDAGKKRLRAFVGLILSSRNSLYIPLIISYVLCGYEVYIGTMTPGTFLVYTTLANHANAWVQSLSSTISSMRVSGEHFARFENCISELNTANMCQPAQNGEGKSEKSEIVFEGVKFSYGDNILLNDVSFEIFKGEKVAIQGCNGVGKSTILKLILGINLPTAGYVRVRDQDTAGNASVKIAYVAQDDFFLPASIKDNITLGGSSDHVDQERLKNAALNAGILTEIEDLPNGFDTILNDNGENLSGGQRQRIALARAFYFDSPILLLDEATSAMDPTTESNIVNNIFKFCQEKTVVFVTHNSQIADLCDKVILLNEGKLVLTKKE